MSEMHMLIDSNVVNGVAIGSPSGSLELRNVNSFTEIRGGGKSITGIGSATKGDNRIEIITAKILLEMSAPRVIMMGCPMGESRFYIERTKVDLIGSGGRILGIGTADGNGKIILKSVGFDISISSDEPLAIGAREEDCDFGASEPNIEIINYSMGNTDERKPAEE